MKNMIVEMKKGKFAGTLAEVLSETTNKEGVAVYKVRRLDTNRKGTWQVAKCALNEDASIQAIAQAITTSDIARIYQAGIELYLEINDSQNSGIEKGGIYKMIFKDPDATPTVRVTRIENGIVSFTKISDVGGVFPLCTMTISDFRHAIYEYLKVPSEITDTQLGIEVEQPVCADEADKAANEDVDEPSLENIVSEQVREEVETLNNQLTAEDFQKVKTALSECGYKPMPVGNASNISHLGFILPGSKVEREAEQSLKDAVNIAVDEVVDCVIGRILDEKLIGFFENRSMFSKNFFEDVEAEHEEDNVIVFDDIEWIEAAIETTEVI